MSHEIDTLYEKYRELKAGEYFDSIPEMLHFVEWYESNHCHTTYDNEKYQIALAVKNSQK